jgi:hypothetical protein
LVGGVNLETIKLLFDKDDKVAYHTLLDLEGQSAESDEVYAYFDEFVKMLSNEKSYVRVRGFRLICAQARWDEHNKIESNLSLLLNELGDEKPTAVRQRLAALHGLILFKPELSRQITERLQQIDYNAYKESMAPLIRKDVEELMKLMQ